MIPNRCLFQVVLHTTLLYSVLASGPGTEGLLAGELRLLKDVPYKADEASEYDRNRCKLDLYLPKESQNFSTILWFHGGGLQAGDKAGKNSVGVAQRFAEGGIAVASVNYRLHPKVKYPAYIEDAAAAFAFVHGQIEKHGGDKQSIFISGHSAGGYLTSMVGIDAKYLAKHELKLTDVAGLIPISGHTITHMTVRKERGIAKTRPIIDEAAPAYHVSDLSAPWLIFAGTEDLPTRAEENRYFASALRAAGHKDVTYLEVEGRNHGTLVTRIGETDDVVAKAMFEFIERVRP